MTGLVRSEDAIDQITAGERGVATDGILSGVYNGLGASLGAMIAIALLEIGPERRGGAGGVAERERGHKRDVGHG